MSVQTALDNVLANGTVNVLSGTYEENITIDKPLTLLAPDGRDVTTIQGSLDGPGFGTINIANGVDDVTIGAVGQGFKIVGFPLDNAAQEGAAIRFSNASTGSEIIGNELVADGEHALLALYNRAVEDLTVDSNIISGQTFEGIPAGDGFGNQFSTLNVPRQLVVLSGGSGVTNVKNITFTNNEIVGTAGGINADGNPQGNTLVTIDAVGSTISGNTFAGTTTRFGSSLRVRGPDATIEDNAFESDGLTPSNLHLFLQNNTLNNALVDANTFDKGVYVEGDDSIRLVIQPYVDGVPDGRTVNVLSGTYAESFTIETPLTLQGRPSGVSGTSTSAGAPTGAPEIEGIVTIGADDVTINGFVIDGSDATPHNAILGQSGVKNSVISNNTLRTGGSSQTVYFLGNASRLGQPNGENVTIEANRFEGSLGGGLSLGLEVTGGSVTENNFVSSTSFGQVELWGEGISVSNNTFDGAGLSDAFYVRDSFGTYDLFAIKGDQGNAYSLAAIVVGDDIVPGQLAGCTVPSFEEELFLDQGFLEVTFIDTNGIVEVNFVNPNDEDALTNFEASPDNNGYESEDGIRFAFNDPDNAPTEVTFTLQAVIPDDHDDGDTFTASYFAQAVNFCGSTIDVDPIHTLSTEPAEALALHGNYPNPFVGSTTIEFDLPEATDVRLEVFDLMGRTVTTLVDGLMDAGSHQVTWNGTSSTGKAAASGVYILRMKAGDQQLTQRITRVR
jgi:nitrous oxidase accessory protein NosD